MGVGFAYCAWMIVGTGLIVVGLLLLLSRWRR
jgi:hypothetical protein